jgi:hypothetical protein
MAILNKDREIMRYLWDEFNDRWDERHFSFLFVKILQENWNEGISLILQSKTTHLIYKSLAP